MNTNRAPRTRKRELSCIHLEQNLQHAFLLRSLQRALEETT